MGLKTIKTAWAVGKYIARRLTPSKFEINLIYANFDEIAAQNSHCGSLTIVIPTRDKGELLQAAISSIEDSCSFCSVQILIVDNQSQDPRLIKYFEESPYKVLGFPHEFNFSMICNLAIENVKTEFVAFMNNDVVLQSNTCFGHASLHLRDESVLTVGAKLNFPDGKIQHLGIALGHNALASHPFRGVRSENVPLGISEHCYEVSGVTFAFAMALTSSMREFPLDERFPSGLNDVIFAEEGLSRGLHSIVCNELRGLHLESASRLPVWRPRAFYRAAIDVYKYLYHFGDLPKGDQYFPLVKLRSY